MSLLNVRQLGQTTTTTKHLPPLILTKAGGKVQDGGVDLPSLLTATGSVCVYWDFSAEPVVTEVILFLLCKASADTRACGAQM